MAEQEIPVVAPLTLQDSSTLGDHGEMHFAVFPKKGGRSFDEYNDDQWLELGRLLGRVHNVGAKHLPKDRVTMAPDRLTREQVDYILTGNFIPADLMQQFQDVTTALIKEINPLLNDSVTIPLFLSTTSKSPPRSILKILRALFISSLSMNKPKLMRWVSGALVKAPVHCGLY